MENTTWPIFKIRPKKKLIRNQLSEINFYNSFTRITILMAQQRIKIFLLTNINKYSKKLKLFRIKQKS
jgi:hypothetical protein